MTTDLEPIEDAVMASCTECDVTLLVEVGKSQKLQHGEDGSHGYDPEVFAA
jgi:hypothetical protein